MLKDKKISVFTNPVRYITTADEVAEFCKQVSQESFVTVDTEFVREKTYWPQLCLVQIGGKDQTALIDACVPGLDLKPLGELMAKPDCLKVFHAARQDLEIFFHLFGKLPKNVFDTQIAARAEGLGDQIGYDALVSALTKGRIDKSHRFTDWAKRPLSENQKTYAVADVTHLRLVYLELMERLTKNNRLSWLKDDLANLENEEFFFPAPDTLWEKISLRGGGRRAMGILQLLAAWREAEAQAADIPRQRLLRDDVLAQTAITAPQNAEALANIRGFPAKLAYNDLGARLLKMIAKGRAIPEDQLPLAPTRKGEKMTPRTKLIANLLSVLLELKAHEHSVSPKVVASNVDLNALAHGRKEVDTLKGWRADIFGKEALDLLEGRLSLQIKGGQVTAVKSQA
ncbi:ribonuclease D [Acetobacteraceae bacterium]|nr:ribonuclease D [Acetobacteraceae bacterium]